MWGIVRPECGREILRRNKAGMWRIGRENSKDGLWKGKQKDMGMESAGKRLEKVNMYSISLSPLRNYSPKKHIKHQ